VFEEQGRIGFSLTEPQRQLEMWADQVELRKGSLCTRLQNAVNYLIRWYRVASRDTAAHELSLSALSPFRFSSGGQLEAAWSHPMVFEPTGPLMRRSFNLGEFQKTVDTGREPAVEDQFLLDAEEAVNEGRFREAVLFSWAVIDATFSQRYEQLIEQRLADDWADGRDSLKGLDLGLRTKMTVMLRLVAGRSLFLEPHPFWEELSKSYTVRNDIIHRGETVAQDEAERAIRVATSVVQIMQEVRG